MSGRKKWRLRLIPPFRNVSASSKVDAYRTVEGYRQDYALGLGYVHRIIVEVDEGHGWRLYEHVVFPERGA